MEVESALWLVTVDSDICSDGLRVATPQRRHSDHRGADRSLLPVPARVWPHKAQAASSETVPSGERHWGKLT